MSDALQILREASSVLAVDWPSPDVPESLARAGYTVFVKGGPGPRDYAVRELRNREVVARRLDDRPEHVDLVYAHRPLAELPGIVALGTEMGMRALWWQSGLSGPGQDDPRGCWTAEEDSLQARAIAERAGIGYVDDVYIADAARELAA